MVTIRSGASREKNNGISAFFAPQKKRFLNLAISGL